jgi:hypothetical protein
LFGAAHHLDFPCAADKTNKSRDNYQEKERCAMFAFTIIGFVLEGGRHLDFQLEVLAESPVEAMEKVKRQDGRAVVSSVSRNPKGWGSGY